MGRYKAEEFGFSRRVCRGVFVGSCVRGHGRDAVSTRSVDAHAHNWRGDDFYGWICVSSERRLFTPTGAPTRVMWHEYAHLLVPDANHGRRWRKVMSELGWPSEARRYGDR